MKNVNRRHLLLVLCSILLTGAVMGLTAFAPLTGRQALDRGHRLVNIPDGTIAVKAHLVQNKVLLGSEGTATLALTLQASAADRPPEETAPVDLVVVLDRSGSMNGRKIRDARRAVLALMDTLAPKDRLGIVTYSSSTEILSDLRSMTAAHRQALTGLVKAMRPGGGTNLGGGLEAGQTLFAEVPGDEHHRKLLLISDGLANHGITDPHLLGRMAASSMLRGEVVSTVGVGVDFNERLMTSLADDGGGTYTYLEDPAAFAAVFQQEYHSAAATAASGLSISVPLNDGIRLIDAGGYPIATRHGRATFHPGGLRFGQTRTLYLTFKVPTDAPGEVSFEGLALEFDGREGRVAARLAQVFTIACIPDAAEVLASIHKDSWGAQVVQEDFGRLKAAVADALREGDQAQALRHIAAYRQEKEALNRVVASPQVAENLATEVGALGDVVRETFAGRPEAVRAKQKKTAKVLQYESYQERRSQR